MNNIKQITTIYGNRGWLIWFLFLCLSSFLQVVVILMGNGLR